jgi:hypothetical protein
LHNLHVAHGSHVDGIEGRECECARGDVFARFDFLSVEIGCPDDARGAKQQTTGCTKDVDDKFHNGFCYLFEFHSTFLAMSESMLIGLTKTSVVFF